MNMDRPHTISSAYERTHSRPALSAHTFEPPEHLRDHPPAQTAPTSPSPYAVPCIIPPKQAREPKIYESLKNLETSKIYDSTIYDRPPSVGPKPKGKAVAPPTVPDFMNPAPDQSKKTNGKGLFYSACCSERSSSAFVVAWTGRR